MTPGLPVLREYDLTDDARDFTYYFDDLNDVRRRIVRSLALPPDLHFLDIGTGDGWYPLAFKEALPLGLVATIELAPNEAENARRRALKIGDTGTQFLSMDAYQIGFANASFDGAGSFLAVQDICATPADLTRLMTETARVLKPRGFLAIAVITPEDAENESQQLGIELYQFIRASYFSRAELTASLSAAGYESPSFSFFDTNVDLSPESALEFIKFQCGWWVDTFQMPTVDWRTTWKKFGPRIEKLGGVQVDAKITLAYTSKK